MTAIAMAYSEVCIGEGEYREGYRTAEADVMKAIEDYYAGKTVEEMSERDSVGFPMWRSEESKP
jgi:uncharacterized protein CbrC (UPF0167 family)